MLVTTGSNAGSQIRRLLPRPLSARPAVQTTSPRDTSPILERNASFASVRPPTSARRYSSYERRDALDAGKKRPSSASLRRPESALLVRRELRPTSALVRDSCSPPRSKKLESLDAEGNLEIARTYFMEGVRMGAKGPDGREVVLQNFTVKINPDEVSESPLCDYLRIYYSDTLGKAPAPDFLTKDQRTIDVEVLCRWLLDNTPRTRVDALPYLILTKDVVRINPQPRKQSRQPLSAAWPWLAYLLATLAASPLPQSRHHHRVGARAPPAAGSRSHTPGADEYANDAPRQPAARARA